MKKCVHTCKRNFLGWILIYEQRSPTKLPTLNNTDWLLMEHFLSAFNKLAYRWGGGLARELTR